MKRPATTKPSKVRMLYRGQYLRIKEIARDKTGRIVGSVLDFADRQAASLVEPYQAAELADAYETGDGSWITTEIA